MNDGNLFKTIKHLKFFGLNMYLIQN